MLWEPHPHERGAAVLLAVLGATDWVDGWIARHFDQGSELGKILDPDRRPRAAGRGRGRAAHPGTADRGQRDRCGSCSAREVLDRGRDRGARGSRARAASTSSGRARRARSRSCSRCRCSSIADAAASVRTLFDVLGWGFAIGGIVLGYFAAREVRARGAVRVAGGPERHELAEEVES